jgi:amino acid permease
MDVFRMGLKSDEALKKYLNSGVIENNGLKKENDDDIHIDDLMENKEKMNIGIDNKDTDNDNNENFISHESEVQNKSSESTDSSQDSSDNNLVEHKKRSLFHKIFGPMEAGSIRGSIFNMAILSLGTGMLSLPRYIQDTSLALSCVLIIIICIIVWWSLLLLSKACEKNNLFNYSRLIKKLYGKCLAGVYDAIVILYSFGILILYNVIIFTNLSEAVHGIFFYKEYKRDDFIKKSFWNAWYIKYVIPYASSILIVYPMCLIKDVSKLRIISLIGVVCIIGLVSIIFYQAADFIDFKNPDINYYDVRKGNIVGMLNFISSVFFAACFHIGCVPVINTLKNNVRRRIYKAIRRTILIDIIFYISVSAVGYLSIPRLDKGLIIQRCPSNRRGQDIVMGIGKIGLVFTFFTKLPNTYSSLRITLFDKIWGTTEITNTKNYIVTFIVIMSCVTVSIVYKEISSYVKIMGGIFSTLVGFLFPALLIVRANRRKRYHWKNILTMMLFCSLTLIGFASSGITVYEEIKGPIFNPINSTQTNKC